MIGNRLDFDYKELMNRVLKYGDKKFDRTGTGTISLTGAEIRHDMRTGFPLLTTKKVHFHSVKHELLWFISGSTNTDYLHHHNVSIWDSWQGEDGELGPVYGYFWGKKLQKILKNLRHDPFSRRHLMISWDDNLLDQQALPPCHYSVQFLRSGPYLDLIFTMRSTDVFLGLPFNLASYGLLLCLVAQEMNVAPRWLVYHGADVHIYNNHIDQVNEQLTRSSYPLPQLVLTEYLNVDEHTGDTIQIVNYQHHPHISAAVSK